MAQDRGERATSPDELLAKLDQLVSRGRHPGGAQPKSVPVLMDSLQSTAGDDIPTLSETVSGPGHASNRIHEIPDLGSIVSTRLSDSVDREIGRLASEYPPHRPALAEFQKVMAQNLPALFRKCWDAISGTGSNAPDSGDSQPENSD